MSENKDSKDDKSKQIDVDNSSNSSFTSAEDDNSEKAERKEVFDINVSSASTSTKTEVTAPATDSDEDNMAGDSSKLEFCLEKDDWNLFAERLELLFDMKDIKEEKQHIWLLTRLDEEAYKLIKSLCAPALPKSKTYGELKTLMENHLRPKPSEVMERCTFSQAKQLQSESVAEFEARLKRLALNCNFTDLSTALRDQSVVGIRDEETRISLFKPEK